MTTSAVCSAVSRGNIAEHVGLPASQRFSRRPESSLKRLPERATSVRLITIGPPSCGFVARRTTPSPTWNPRASSRVISRSYQSESSARATVRDGILVRIVSAPLPTSRTREGRKTALRRVYVPGQEPDGPAAEPGDVVERRLDDLVVAAGEVGVAAVGPDGERQPLVPVRLEARRRRRSPAGRSPGGGRHRPGPGDGRGPGPWRWHQQGGRHLNSIHDPSPLGRSTTEDDGPARAQGKVSWEAIAEASQGPSSPSRPGRQRPAESRARRVPAPIDEG